MSVSDLAKAFSIRRNLRSILFRPDTDRGHLGPLDGLRALGLLWVLLIHVGWYGWYSLPRGVYLQLLHARWMLPVWRGDFAVDLFFVLSGFLIGRMLLDEREKDGGIAVGPFYLRRLLRLWPALLFVLVVEWAWHGQGRTSTYPIWPNALYINNLFPIHTVRMGHTWSLAIEEQFYLVVPWLLLGLVALGDARRSQGKRGDPVLWGLAALAGLFIALVIAIVWANDLHVADSEIAFNRGPRVWERGYNILYSKPWMRLGPLLTGVGCARLYRRPGFMDRLGRSGLAGAVVLVLALVLGALATHWPLFSRAPRVLELIYLGTFRTVFGVASGYLLLFVLTPHPVGAAIGRFLSAPIFYPLAQLAYCAYLVNPMVAGTTHGAFAANMPSAGVAFVVFALVDVPITLAAGLVLAVLVERPFMALRSVLVPHRPRARSDRTPEKATPALP